MTGKETLGHRLRRAVPFGLLEKDKPRHYREMLRIAWQNKDHPVYATRILRHGVCDGCSLGPRGLKDDVMEGTHLCLTRLNLLRLNTMGAMEEGAWEDGARLRAMSNEELRALGRVPYPLVMRRGDAGLRRVSWDEAIALAAAWMRGTPPDRSGFFVTSRGITNETYYVAQKLARVYGTNNVDLCSRLCHAPSVVGLRSTIGYGAPTCSLSDFVGTDLVVLFGTDLANNQPVTMKYLHEAKKLGTKVVVVNPVREPGLARYWVPSVPSSALWGTAIMDEFFQVSVGGDIAFVLGALKALLEIPAGIDRAFIEAHTTGWLDLETQVRGTPWEDLEASAGLPRAEMERFARLYAGAKTAVLVWSMGITQHANGVDNVRAIVDLCLARGMIGRRFCGLMPIRGHSGVQGGGECGVDPHRFPGGVDVSPASAKRFETLWGRPVPHEPGLMTGEMIEAVLAGEMDLLYLVGGNLRETMPDPRAMESALRRVRFRIHQDILLNSSTVVEAGEAVLVLPGQTRYEQRSGGTTTSTERRIRFTPEIPGPRIGEAKPEWEIPALVGRAVAGPGPFDYADTAAIRREMVEAMPMYAGVDKLAKEGDSLQWGGPQLCRDGDFDKMPDHRARFSPVRVPPNLVPPGLFQVSTRRGKQFNSIVFRTRDPQLGDARRDDVLVSDRDAAALGLAGGDRVVLANDVGRFEGRVRVADVPPRHVVLYWPEGNVLLARRYDPEAGIPDYNAFVRLEKAA
ncbi:MAG TPA: FdhF/YdeP family oxidoreductase [Candidatus Thermoplasmatota archaeon]|nr:FdhF/YdeP family oxidoreductase [Candidatus Thermoplasmatota archaeon]